MRNGAGVARWSHKPQAVGSNPTSAPKSCGPLVGVIGASGRPASAAHETVASMLRAAPEFTISAGTPPDMVIRVVPGSIGLGSPQGRW